MRAGDWTVAADGQLTLELKWEDATAGRSAPSDGFIGVESQKFIPSPTISAIHGNADGTRLNHGHAITLYDPIYYGHINQALDGAGAH